MTADWMRERPEPIVAEAMATEAAIERRRAVNEPHPLDCNCRECIAAEAATDQGDEFEDWEPSDSLLPYFGPEDYDRDFAGPAL